MTQQEKFNPSKKLRFYFAAALYSLVLPFSSGPERFSPSSRESLAWARTAMASVALITAANWPDLDPKTKLGISGLFAYYLADATLYGKLFKPKQP